MLKEPGAGLVPILGFIDITVYFWIENSLKIHGSQLFKLNTSVIFLLPHTAQTCLFLLVKTYVNIWENIVSISVHRVKSYSAWQAQPVTRANRTSELLNCNRIGFSPKSIIAIASITRVLKTHRVALFMDTARRKRWFLPQQVYCLKHFFFVSLFNFSHIQWSRKPQGFFLKCKLY